MPIKREKRDSLILLALLLVVTTACILLWYLGRISYNNRVDYQHFSSDDGVYDLRGFDFTDTVLRLSGNAEYIQNEFLTPDEFEVRARAGEIETGRMEGYGSVSTTRVRLILPDAKTLMLVCDSSDYAEILYINGEFRGQAGRPGLTGDDEIPRSAYCYYSVSPVKSDSGEYFVEIVRQVSNFAHRSGGGHASIYIGSEENGRLNVSLVTDYESITAGLFFALFFIHLTLYIILRSYRTNLYFAALCLAWALRSGVRGTKVFLTAIPALSWETAFRIEYLSLPVCIIFITLIIKEIFPDVMHKWPSRIIIIGASVFGVFYLFADTYFMSLSLFWCYVFYIATIIWLLVRFAMKLPGLFKNHEITLGHFASLFGLAVFMYAAVHDALYHNDIYLFGLNRSLTDVAMLIFCFAQMIAMSYETIREFAAVREAEQRQAQENAALDRLNRMKSELMTNLTHEIRTPLTVMSTYAQLAIKALQNEDSDAQTAADLEVINQESKRLAELASDTLNVFGKAQESERYYPVSADEIIAQIARLFTPSLDKKSNNIVLNLQDGLPCVLGNADKLTQVVWNLLSNANEHTKDGEISINAVCENSHLHVTVRDNGTGIDPELLPNLFKRHSNVSAGHAGIGLSICREIIEEHGGRIWVDSELRSGTAVHFTLPAAVEGDERQVGDE